MKSLEPYQKKLGTDTWFYTKRCFLALFENMSKHLILLKDSFIGEIIQFLTHCESKKNNKVLINYFRNQALNIIPIIITIFKLNIKKLMAKM